MFAVGPRGGAVAEGTDGGVIVRGPQGNGYVGWTVDDRMAVLPDSANSLIVGDQTYYVDGSGVYYLPCCDPVLVAFPGHFVFRECKPNMKIAVFRPKLVGRLSRP